MLQRRGQPFLMLVKSLCDQVPVKLADRGLRKWARTQFASAGREADVDGGEWASKCSEAVGRRKRATNVGRLIRVWRTRQVLALGRCDFTGSEVQCVERRGDGTVRYWLIRWTGKCYRKR